MAKLTSAQADEISSLLLKTEDADVADRLTTWEKDFIADIAEQYSNIEWLSEKQIGRLTKIVEGDPDGSSRENRRAISRPKRTSYGSSEALRPASGGFSGFTSESPKDKPSGDDE